MSDPHEAEVERVKDRLDLFAEMTLYHAQLCRAFFAADDAVAAESATCDRRVHRDAFKALVDTARWLESGRSGEFRPETRAAATEAIRRDRSSPFHPLISRFVAWQDRHYAPWPGARDLIAEALHRTFVTLRDEARELEKALPRAGEGPRTFEVVTTADGYPRDAVTREEAAGEWADAAGRILDACASVVTAVWPSYHHVYVVTRDDVDATSLAGAAAATEAVLGACAPALLPARRPEAPALQCSPLFVPASALEPILFSCYLNKPFKYYDFRYEPVHSSAGGFGQDPAEPAHALVDAMARESAAHLLLTIRMDLRRMESGVQLLRVFLRVLGLAAFAHLRKVAIPLSAAADVFRSGFPDEADWVEPLWRDCLASNQAGGGGIDEVYRRYYPRIKGVLNGVLPEPSPASRQRSAARPAVHRE